MKERELVAQEQHIISLFNRANVFNNEPEMLSHWAKYICILTSGFIENAIRYYLSEFAVQKAHSNVANYVANDLDGFQNPNMDKILNVVGAFSKEWREELAAFVEGERKDAIDSIVSNRHSLAHGRSIGLTFSRMQQYFKKVQEVVDFIGQQVRC